jgi:hypothetical protein
VITQAVPRTGLVRWDVTAEAISTTGRQQARFLDGALIRQAASYLPGVPVDYRGQVIRAEHDEGAELNRAALREDVWPRQFGWRFPGIEACELSPMHYAARYAHFGAFGVDEVAEHPGRPEGTQWEIRPGPGSIQVRCRDYGRLEKRRQRQAVRDRKSIDVLAASDEPRPAIVDNRCPRCGGPWSPGSGCADAVCAALTGEVADAEYSLAARERERKKELAGTKIMGWSRKSRNELRHKIGRLDLTPLAGPGRVLEVLTLTAPGTGGDPEAPEDAYWMLVAPDGAAWHRALRRFRERWKYRWCERVDDAGKPILDPSGRKTYDLVYAVLKQEFQRRSAPHEHLMAGLPENSGCSGRIHPDFKEWLSEAWAESLWYEVVRDAPDPDRPGQMMGRKWMTRPTMDVLLALEQVLPGAGVAYLKHLQAGTRVGTREKRGRITDPRRAAEYFLKEGISSSKGYQDEAPEQWTSKGRGTGRIWQVWGLKEATTTVAVEPHVGIAAGRVMRRWYRAELRHDVERANRIPFGPCRNEREQGLRDRAWRLRRRRGLFRHNRGRAMVEDGEAFTMQLGRYLQEHVADLDLARRGGAEVHEIGHRGRLYLMGPGLRLMRMAAEAEGLRGAQVDSGGAKDDPSSALHSPKRLDPVHYRAGRGEFDAPRKPLGN